MDKYTLKRIGNDLLKQLAYRSSQSIAKEINDWCDKVVASNFVYQRIGKEALRDMPRDIDDRNRVRQHIQAIISSI